VNQNVKNIFLFLVVVASVVLLWNWMTTVRAGAEEIAVFTAASETFNRKNINASIAASLERIRALAGPALDRGMRIRGYISCVLGCPYEGEVHADKVVEVAQALFELGCYEVSLGDTIGLGTPVAARRRA
jgi:isopropylmalate/homocitrate/citramalate synthase